MEDTVESIDGVLRHEIDKYNTQESFYHRLVQALADDDDTLHAGMVMVTKKLLTPHNADDCFYFLFVRYNHEF